MLPHNPLPGAPQPPQAHTYTAPHQYHSLTPVRDILVWIEVQINVGMYTTMIAVAAWGPYTSEQLRVWLLSPAGWIQRWPHFKLSKLLGLPSSVPPTSLINHI